MNHPTIFFESCSMCNRHGQYKWPGYCSECGQQHDRSFHLSDKEYANLPKDTLWVYVDRLDNNGWTYGRLHAKGFMPDWIEPYLRERLSLLYGRSTNRFKQIETLNPLEIIRTSGWGAFQDWVYEELAIQENYIE